MAYQVDKFNGTFLTSVEDGTIDSTTDIRFVGKNYAGYGEVQNENFLHLLENFANTSAPPRTIVGQIWYDSGNKKLKYYDGDSFKVAGGAETGTAAPTGLQTGEFWWDTSSNQLYTWSGTDFVLVGPESSPDLGASAAVPQVVKDVGNTNHTILKLSAGGKVIGIISQTAFTLNNDLNPIEGFSEIKKGFTLVDTNADGVSENNFVYWGTSSNSLKLGGFGPDEFLKQGDAFEGVQRFRDAGFTLGDDNDLAVFVDPQNGETLYIENQLGTDINFRITVSQQDVRDVFKITASAIQPGETNTFDIGSPAAIWRNIYANTVIASLTGNVTGNITGNVTGDLLGQDTTKLIDSATNIIGYNGASLRGTLIGDVQGNVQGNATNASRLNNIDPSIAIPSAVDKTSVVVRDSTGRIFGIFDGTSNQADRLLINDSATDTDPNYRSAKTTKTANTIAARDSSGNLAANVFNGTATSARYADLAEKYLADSDYEVGTVMKVGGEREITAASIGDRAIGVISENPAFMMNSELEDGVYVALKGRVPVKVKGPVKKGDTLIAYSDGYAVQGKGAEVFAISLEESSDPGNKTIEAVIL